MSFSFDWLLDQIKQSPSLTRELLVSLGISSRQAVGSRGKTQQLLELIAEKLPSWKPIDTAPKDRSVFVGGRFTKEIYWISEARWHNNQWFETNGNQRVNPTYWTEHPTLPPLPEEDQ